MGLGRQRIAVAELKSIRHAYWLREFSLLARQDDKNVPSTHLRG